MQSILASYLIGLVFGLGLVVSQMVNPKKVLDFLDIAGNWDPSLVLVMAGAVVVTAAGYRLAWRFRKPLLAERFEVPSKRELDARLLGGAAIFGIGWGLAGICPGPALTALGTGRWEAVLFVLSMIAGMVLFRAFSGLGARKAA
jgi:uncharacterized membrane protein YedE/YeeE